MQVNLNEIVWSQKYRPNTIEEIILPKNIKSILEGIVAKGEMLNLLFAGGSGMGKTTAAKALFNQMGYDYYSVNGSKEGTIDKIRNELTNYASSVSLDGKRKVIFIDEADGITHASQLALRSFIEEYSSNCAFVFTCNYPNRIMPEIRGRFSEIDFVIPTNEKADLFKKLIIRCVQILQNEKVEFDPEAVGLICKELFPNFRKILNELQKESNKGKIDVGSFVHIKNDDVSKLVSLLKSKDFLSVKKWVSEHQDVELNKLSELLYEIMAPLLDVNSLPELILIRAAYDYKNAFVVNKVLNIEAMLVEIMKSVNYK